jgi:hypothetical protein
MFWCGNRQQYTDAGSICCVCAGVLRLEGGYVGLLWQRDALHAHVT